MQPVHTKDCDVVYKGPSQEIGDLWCKRIRPGVIRVTYEPNEIELELLKNGGRVQLTLMKEPIPPVMMEVVDADISQPIAPHGWKIDVDPGDKLPNTDEPEELPEPVKDEVI